MVKFQEAEYDDEQMSNIHFIYKKNQHKCIVLFADNEKDQNRLANTKRLYDATPCSKIAGQYDESFAVGICTDFNDRQEPINQQDFETVVTKQFEFVATKLSNGIDIIVPAPDYKIATMNAKLYYDEERIKSDKNYQYMTFDDTTRRQQLRLNHTLGVQKLNPQQLQFITNKIKELVDIASGVEYAVKPVVYSFSGIMEINDSEDDNNNNNNQTDSDDDDDDNEDTFFDDDDDDNEDTNSVKKDVILQNLSQTNDNNNDDMYDGYRKVKHRKNCQRNADVSGSNDDDEDEERDDDDDDDEEEERDDDDDEEDEEEGNQIEDDEFQQIKQINKPKNKANKKKTQKNQTKIPCVRCVDCELWISCQYYYQNGQKCWKCNQKKNVIKQIFNYLTHNKLNYHKHVVNNYHKHIVNNYHKNIVNNYHKHVVNKNKIQQLTQNMNN